ncbi:MAG: DEAD/DEAH box helicase [Deltaproteobacteria bacterium]|nr:DEAD/DEAH box helicase [Deltaproteobacteria bacterium]
MPKETDPHSSAPRAEKPTFLTKIKFADLDLPDKILSGLHDGGFINCSPIQAQVLPKSLTGIDIAGQAQTGTGKTAAFLVTVFAKLLALKEKKAKFPSALIVAPTRELALQIYEEAKIIGRYTDISLLKVVGGVQYRQQADVLQQGVDIVVGTPGRLIDYQKQKIFKPDNIQIVVIDEADRLLDMGFSKDMRYILRKLPPYSSRQSMLFSATLSFHVMELTYEYMNAPEFISVTPEEVTVKGIEQSLFHVDSKSKFSLLLGLLKNEDWSRVLVFVNTKSGVEWLTKKLKGNGLPAEGITGDLQQKKRFRLMERFKKGNIKMLVATDVASRGIHVEDISHVINYDLPQDPENYIHRIGRTARAGKKGKALSLACEAYVFHLELMEEMLDYKIPVVWPHDEWFLEDKAGYVSSRQKRDAKRPAAKKSKSAVAKPGKKKEAPRVKKGVMPGSFFGFGPEEDLRSKPQEPPKKMPHTRKRKKKAVRRKESNDQ